MLKDSGGASSLVVAETLLAVALPLLAPKSPAALLLNTPVADDNDELQERARACCDLFTGFWAALPDRSCALPGRHREIGRHRMLRWRSTTSHGAAASVVSAIALHVVFIAGGCRRVCVGEVHSCSDLEDRPESGAEPTPP